MNAKKIIKVAVNAQNYKGNLSKPYAYEAKYSNKTVMLVYEEQELDPDNEDVRGEVQLKPVYLKPQSLPPEMAEYIERLETALAEIREIYAGSEIGEPVYAQEAYAIRLLKQCFNAACDALASKPKQ